ncbi:ester cyclase [Anaeromyxobacter oryzae]|uniref:Cyclase n=1 Tax=Anaeromyxobacter oryzae TaxID=2918170 RepID=A0ABM7WQS4_9BACT|nr:ester cyclase [Anaeromyxobacter oryzae]BDG01813.1 cyclase [Anaeromyxobacter oryzae]
MASSTVRTVFEKGTSAFNAHDVDAMAETMTDDVSTRAPGGTELSGKQAVKAFYKSWIDAFPDAHVDIKAVHVLDDVAVEEGVFTGTHRATLKSPGGDLPATGRNVSVEYIQVLRFRGDRVASFHLVFDRAEMLEQLGLAPSPEAMAASGRRGEAAAQPIQPH